MVVWAIDRLDTTAPAKPKSKYARDIHYNEELKLWERRVTATWNVVYRVNQNYTFSTSKEQGLNLETLEGFHFIDNGLPAHPPPQGFKDVRLTYPIFYSERVETFEEPERLQKLFISNLFFIYDPYSWVARRNSRFRGGHIEACREHIKGSRIYVTDRQWFDEVLARFLSDVTTIKLEGADEIYSLQMLSKRIWETPRTLGLGFDPLNWNRKEKREAKDAPQAKGRSNINESPRGFRYALIDAYQRYGDELVNRIRTQLLTAKEHRQKINGRAMLMTTIEELSGLTWREFENRATETQDAHLAEHLVTGGL